MKRGILARVIHGAGANAVTQVVIAVVQLSLVATLTSHWGLQLYGWWVVVSTIPSYLALSDLGFASAAAAEMTMQVARGDRKGATSTFQGTRAAIGLLSLAILIVALLMTWTLPDSIIQSPEGLPPITARVTLSLLCAQALVALQSAPLMAAFRSIGLYAFGEYTLGAIFFAEGAAAILTGLSGYSPMSVAAAMVLSRAGGVAAQAILLRRRAPWLPFHLRSISWSDFRRLYRPSAAVFALSAAQITFLQGTTLAVSAASTASAAAIFTSVRTLTRIGVQLTSLVNRSLAPEYAVAAAQSQRATQARILLISLGVGILLLASASTILALYGVEIVWAWTHGTIHASWPFIYVMTAVMIVHGLWSSISNLLLASNRHEALAYKYFALSIASVVLAYILSSFYAELGGGLSLLALDLSTAAVTWHMATRIIVPPSELVNVARGDLTKLMQWIRSRLFPSREPI